MHSNHFDTVPEILVVDGGSTDKTVKEAENRGASIVHSPPGRAVQMNRGAFRATGEILYFLHADTFPPAKFDLAIRQAMERGYEAGCFRLKFDSGPVILSFFAWFSQFNFPVCRGGDQSLFITKSLFLQVGGYNEDYRIYEDNELTSRLYRLGRFCVLPQYVTTSARRYRQRNPILLQYHFGIMHFKNYMGVGPQALYRYYLQNID
jgi:rSAM/selenodomain-associated transferase 2